MKEKKKVMLVGNRSHKRITGLSIAFEMLVSDLDKNNMNHIIIDKSPTQENASAGKFNLVSGINTVGTLLKISFNLFKVDIVYNTISSSKLGFFRDFFIIWLSKLFNKKIILHLHGGGYKDFYYNQNRVIQKFIRITLMQSDSIIVLGDLLKDQFSFLDNIDQKIQVVPNGLPDGLTPKINSQRTLKSSKTVKLLYLSNMIESKGYLDVLEAVRILKNDIGLNIECDFCGSFVRTTVNGNSLTGEEAKDQFQKLVKEFSVENVVNYRGVVKGDEKQNILASADMFILPTYYPWEGQPISIIEAQAFGLPCISTNFRGIPEQIKNGYNGFLINPKSPNEIVNSVRSLIEDPGEYKKFSKNALTLFNLKFTQETHLKKMKSVIFGLQKP